MYIWPIQASLARLKEEPGTLQAVSRDRDTVTKLEEMYKTLTKATDDAARDGRWTFVCHVLHCRYWNSLKIINIM